MFRPALLSLLLLWSCSSSLRRPESTQVVLTGTLTAGGFDARGDHLVDATVRVVNPASGAELAKNVTSSAGGYRLTLDLTAPTRIVFLAEAEGFAPIAQALTVGPSTELTLSAALSPAVPFECVDTTCDAPFTDLQWVDPPMDAAGSAAVFHDEPPVRVDVDERRSPIAVLGWVKVTSAHSGRFLLRVPRAQWGQLEDAVPGNGSFEVRVARFDVGTASWSTLSPVPLVTEAGLAVPEGAATFSAGALASIPALTDGFYAVLGSAVAAGCITSSLVAEGSPAVGASFSFPGFEPVVASGEGATFCARGPVTSEAVRVEGQYAGLRYAYGEVAAPAEAGACGGTCRSVPPIELRAGAVKTVSLCDFTGTVVDAEGQPVPSAAVVAMDETVTANAVTAFCGELGTRCRLAAATGADGAFRLVVPFSSGLVVGARTSTEGLRGAAARLDACPSTALTLPLSYGERVIAVDATLTGATVSWAPAVAAARVTVVDAVGDTKWEIVSPAGIAPPVVFGTVPSGATQTVAPTSSLTSGDAIGVELAGVDEAGVSYSGIGAVGVE